MININENITIYHGDCLDIMPTLGKVDMILTDPPYGTTKCKWDVVIPFNEMWPHIIRVSKDDRATVLFGSEPFTSFLICSNVDYFKYKLIWRKNKIQHFAQAPYRFLTETEDILVFSKGGASKQAKNRMIYNPQGLIDCNKVCKGKAHSDHRPSNKTQDDYIQTKTGYPKNILEFKSESKPIHPTQKPVELLEYLIKTYTNEGDTVLDFAAGSFSTAIACINTNRKFIGIEKDEHYFNVGHARILEHLDINCYE